MNQNLKECVYGKGNDKQVDFLANLGGMNDEEKKVFIMLHKGKPDTFIQDELGISRSAFIKIEDSVRTKLNIAVFDCINIAMNKM